MFLASSACCWACGAKATKQQILEIPNYRYENVKADACYCIPNTMLLKINLLYLITEYGLHSML